MGQQWDERGEGSQRGWKRGDRVGVNSGNPNLTAERAAKLSANRWTPASAVGSRGATSSGKYPFAFFYLSCLLFKKTKQKKRAFLCFTPPEMNLGINFFWILGSSSTFRLFNSYKSKKVSGRFPDAELRVGGAKCWCRT